MGYIESQLQNKIKMKRILVTGGAGMISSNLGAMTSIITNGQNGFHFEPGNMKSLKEVVHRFNALSSLEKKQMSTAAFDTYKSFYSPELQLGYFEAIYNTIIIEK